LAEGGFADKRELEENEERFRKQLEIDNANAKARLAAQQANNQAGQQEAAKKAVEQKKKANPLDVIKNGNPGGPLDFHIARARNQDDQFAQRFYEQQRGGLAIRQALAHGIRRPGQEPQRRIQANAYSALFDSNKKSVLNDVTAGVLNKNIDRFRENQIIQQPFNPLAGNANQLGNNQDPKQANAGGGVNGDAAAAMNGFAKAAAALPESAQAMGENIAKFTAAMGTFGDLITKLSELPEKFKGTLNLEGNQRVEVTGAITLSDGKGKEEVSTEVQTYIGKAIEEAFKRRLPDLTT
jgi:hypothetical protein